MKSATENDVLLNIMHGYSNSICCIITLPVVPIERYKDNMC